jgi:hypothetical protein
VYAGSKSEVTLWVPAKQVESPPSEQELHL